VRIAIDIDSTLHHYWDQFEAAAKRRFGIELPYREQLWHIDRLRPEQVRACVEETHTDARILAAEPYPNAVETVRAWKEAGHFIHITSHRHAGAHAATERWLIDDSPVNLAAAVEAGMRGATISHPWNRDICEEEDIVCAPDWPALARALEPLLQGAPR
jgi:FMN phosphatase YigB (HAD superfamily)